MPELATAHGVTRRQLLRGAGAAAALAAAGGGAAELLRRPERASRIRSFAVKPAGPVRVFRSRPDLRPPTVTTVPPAAPALFRHDDPRLLFLGPGPVSLTGSQQYGPMIVDPGGEPVWFRPLPTGVEVTNFAVSRYRNQPVLVWWEGKVDTSGYGQGEAVIVDRSYRELTRVQAANGRVMDMHALWLTPQGTAMFTCYAEAIPGDLSSIGGPRHGQVRESVIQEVDVASGRLLFEWRSLQHIPVGDSYHPFTQPYDYLHVNSISPTSDGNLLVSGRNTWTLYKLERDSGEVLWRLGGKRSEFQLDAGARFAWQHDARQVSDQALTLFDNGTNGPIESERESRGLVLDVDESHRTVALSEAYTSPEKLLASAMGSLQILPSGDVVVGWGTASHTSEFASDGTLLFDAALPAGLYSYRGLRLPWSSVPDHRPAIAAGRDPHSGTPLVYASWNGATDVTDWRVEAGPAPDRLHPIGIARHRGFETVIPLHPALRFASVTALNASAKRLKRSPTVKL